MAKPVTECLFGFYIILLAIFIVCVNMLKSVTNLAQEIHCSS